MRPEDFFDTPAPLTAEYSKPEVDLDLLTRLRAAPLRDHDDVEVGVALARLVHDDLEAYGTEGPPDLTETGMRQALLALRAIAQRLGIDGFDLPFRTFTTFRSYWMKEGARGSWQARRDLLAKLFDPLHDRLADLETKTLSSTLAEPVSPHQRTGWSRIDTEIGELRRHFRGAQTPQDYRAVGNDCVFVLEGLSDQVYDPAPHLRPGEEEPPVDKTKLRLGRFIEDTALGPQNDHLRALARAAIEMAQQVKHSETPTRQEAGIAADAVIMLANLLRRLAEPD